MLNHVDKDMKLYIKSVECRRKMLLTPFDCCEEVLCAEPMHLCCDNCAKKCDCEDEDCGKLTTYPGNIDQATGIDTVSQTRQVTEQQKATLSSKLRSYHRSLVQGLIGKSAHGQLPTLINLPFMLGFADQQILQVLENCYRIFSLDDVFWCVEIWHRDHAVQILHIINHIYGDCSTQDAGSFLNDDDDNEECDTWLGDWDVLIHDEELFELAIGNISTSLLEASMNDSHENTMENEDIPRAAVSALENLRLL